MAVKTFNPILVRSEEDKIPEFIVASVRVLRGLVALDNKNNLKVYEVTQGAEKYELREKFRVSIASLRPSSDPGSFPLMDVYELGGKNFVYIVYESQAILFDVEERSCRNLTGWAESLLYLEQIYIVDNFLLVAAEKEGLFAYRID